MRLCSRCNQLGETADPCTCDIDLVAADHDIAELKKQLAAAEQRAEQAEREAAEVQRPRHEDASPSATTCWPILLEDLCLSKTDG